MDLDWARDIREQCLKARVPFFFKQVGGRTPKAGGRLLDGREWNEMPTAASLNAWTRYDEKSNGS
jgi:protein gp37